MKFIINNPLIVLLAIIIIYMAVMVSILKKKDIEIKKAYKPIESYLDKQFIEITNILNKVMTDYSGDEKVINEITRLLTSLNSSVDGSFKDKIKTSNVINHFVLNTSLLRTNNYPELNVLYGIELFNPANTPEEVLKARINFNKIIGPYNNSIVIAPTSYIAKILGMQEHYDGIEVNEGKTAWVATGNYVKITPEDAKKAEEQQMAAIKNDPTPVSAPAPVVEPAPQKVQNIDPNITAAPTPTMTTSSEEKACPNCSTRFKDTKFCPNCGTMVE